MRKIIVSNLVSLDGFIAKPNGEIDWFVVGDEFFKYSGDLFDRVDTILFGRVTYEGMAQYWPTSTDDSVIATNMNNLPKVVASRTLDKAEWGTWNNARVLKGDLAVEITRLKEQPGKDIVIYGSGSLVSDLTALGLIDEYHMVVNPVVLGCGKSMFESVTTPVRLTLTHTQTFTNGGIVLFYERVAQPA